MKKKLIIIAILLLIILAILVFYQIRVNRKYSDRLPINTKEGTVKVINFYKNPTEFLTLGGIAIARTADYYIDYYPENDGFFITLLNPNIQISRDLAEAEFLKVLDISKEDACKLNVRLGAPAYVNEKASIKNYGLSFCPQGESF